MFAIHSSDDGNIELRSADSKDTQWIVRRVVSSDGDIPE